jgi:hypothetical protein
MPLAEDLCSVDGGVEGERVTEDYFSHYNYLARRNEARYDHRYDQKKKTTSQYDSRQSGKEKGAGQFMGLRVGSHFFIDEIIIF